MAPWDPPEDLEKLQESRKTSLQCSLSQYPIEDSPLGGPRPRQDSQFAGGQWDHGAEEQTPLQPRGSPRGHVASSSRRGEQPPPAEHGGPPSPGSLGGKREP